MKRLIFTICICSTLALVGVIVYRTTTKKEPPSSQPTQQQTQQAVQIADSFAQVITRPASLESFNQTVQERAGTNLDNLSEIERKKLFGCIDRFYACYSSGDFDAFKQFRMRSPFVVKEEIAAYFRKIAASKGMDLKSDEDILRFGWNYKNGTNSIGQVNEERIVLSISTRHDLGMGPDLRQPASGKFPGLGASCWEGAVIYQPAPPELLKKEGALRFFKLEFFARFELADGPATPLVLIGYWDPTREDWMPYALCTVLQVGHYDTLF